MRFMCLNIIDSSLLDPVVSVGSTCDCSFRSRRLESGMWKLSRFHTRNLARTCASSSRRSVWGPHHTRPRSERDDGPWPAVRGVPRARAHRRERAREGRGTHGGTRRVRVVRDDIRRHPTRLPGFSARFPNVRRLRLTRRALTRDPPPLPPERRCTASSPPSRLARRATAAGAWATRWPSPRSGSGPYGSAGRAFSPSLLLGLRRARELSRMRRHFSTARARLFSRSSRSPST